MTWKILLLLLVGIGLMILAGRLRQRSVQAAGRGRDAVHDGDGPRPPTGPSSGG